MVKEYIVEDELQRAFDTLNEWWYEGYFSEIEEFECPCSFCNIMRTIRKEIEADNVWEQECAQRRQASKTKRQSL